MSQEKFDNKNNVKEKHSSYNTSSRTASLVVRALLLGLAFILSAIDHSLPSVFPGVPQMSLGLANIVVLFCLIFLSWKDALFITIAKSFSVIFLRGPISFYLSLSGGLLALFVQAIIWQITKKESSLILVSAFGGLSHNIGQILAYSVYAKVNVSILIAPLSILGIISGVLTAIVLRALYPHFVNWLEHENKLKGGKNK